MKKTIIFIDPTTGDHSVVRQNKAIMKVKIFDPNIGAYRKTKKVIEVLQQTSKYIYITTNKEIDN